MQIISKILNHWRKETPWYNKGYVSFPPVYSVFFVMNNGMIVSVSEGSVKLYRSDGLYLNELLDTMEW